MSEDESEEFTLTSPTSGQGPHLSEEQCRDWLDRMCLHGSAWTATLHKMIVAWSYFDNGDRRKGRDLMASCYIPLLPTHRPSCNLALDYRLVQPQPVILQSVASL